MRPLISIALPIFLIAIPAAARDEAWTIGPRVLPPPAHASDALRKVIGSEPTPNLSGAKKNVPSTDAEWKELAAARDTKNAKLAEDVARKLGVSIQEDTIAGVHIYRVTPPNIAPEHKDHLFVHIHGGGWIFNGGKASFGEGMMIAAKTGIPVISIDYRRPPDDPAPAARDDVVAVWQEIIKAKDPHGIALGGTSAGGNLTLVAALRLKELGLPLPAALFVGTPAVDLAKAGDSRFLNDGVDPGLTWDGLIAGAAALYANGKSYDDPYLSPIYGDVTGFPPTYLDNGNKGFAAQRHGGDAQQNAPRRRGRRFARL